jgi:hypothetical protein
MFKAIAVFILAFLGLFTATAVAQSATMADDQSWLEMLKPVYEAFARGEKLYAGMLALVAAVALFKRYAPEKWGLRAWSQSDFGGALLALSGSFGASMAMRLADGASPSWDMAQAATLIAVGAAGGYSLIKKLIIEPFVRPWSAKAPAWARIPLQMLLWAFDRPMPTAKAASAGDQAVASKPASGLGASKDVE